MMWTCQENIRILNNESGGSKKISLTLLSA
jgi:hypothetical protein